MTKLKDDEHWASPIKRFYGEEEMNATAFHAFWLGVGLGSLGLLIIGLLWYVA